MLRSDLDRVIALSRRSIESPQWTRNEYEQILVRYEGTPLLRCAVVAVDGDDLRGFAVASWLEGEAAELEILMVSRECRRQGIGGDLLQACVAWLAKAGALHLRLEVRASNEAALALYRRSGFCATGTRRAYYSAPEEDALLLRMPLLKSNLEKTSSRLT